MTKTPLGTQGTRFTDRTCSIHQQANPVLVAVETAGLKAALASDSVREVWWRDEGELIRVALELGAEATGSLTRAESRLAGRAGGASATVVSAVRERIARGEDPLGEAFCALRSPAERRSAGATYTPPALVNAMVAWAAQRSPTRIVDPGAGSGRFIVAAARRFPRARLIAVENDPLAALLLRAHLFCAGCAERAEVVTRDYRTLELAEAHGPTLFLGNPPYVRHHLIDAAWKQWLTRHARALALPASQLAGLHVHFYLATALAARPGDFGAFVTAAEWLDVNYGALVRGLFLGPLGGTALHVVDPAARVFSDANTTAVVTCFEPGTCKPRVVVRRTRAVTAATELGQGRSVARDRLAACARWTALSRPAARARRDLIELGELCRVHRGQVTGANAVWIASPDDCELPASVLFRSVTRARELFAAGGRLSDASRLRQVIDLPAELDALPMAERRSVERFLELARRRGADRSFIARHRRAWWSVGLREPAPILATYMARRPPAFVRNLAGARHLNIAHGLYPRGALSGAALDALAAYLNTATTVHDGRTYAGGLTKFEPREMERLLVPTPELLAAPGR